MKHYELCYLISGNIPENETEPVMREVTEWLNAAGVAGLKQDVRGRRKLAYPIAKDAYGFYVVHEFDAEPDGLADFRQKIKLHQGIIRYILITRKPYSTRELLMQEIADKRTKKPEREAKKPAAKKPASARTASEKPANEESKIKLEELDKKLDELLDQDIIE